METSAKNLYNTVEIFKESAQIILNNIKKTGVDSSKTYIENENDFEIKLTDYGLAKSYQNNRNSEYSSFVGTYYYMAPEIFKNKGCSKSDLWSIGLILYYLYYNDLPFENLEEYINSNKDIIIKKTEFEILDDILNKLLVKDPNKRINWDNYFIHPFNNLQRIEIFINIECNYKITKIINEYINYHCEQLKDPIIIINEKKKKFNFYYKLKKGKYKIIILFNNKFFDCRKMFDECSDIIEIKFIKFNSENVYNMSEMFSNCSKLTYLDLSNFNTDNVKYMNNMFNNCSNLTNLNLNNFNTEKVKNMRYMFNNCSKLSNLNLSNFNIENVKNMSNIFKNSSNLINLDISNFNTNKVEDMEGMFQNCSNITNLNINKFNS